MKIQDELEVLSNQWAGVSPKYNLVILEKAKQKIDELEKENTRLTNYTNNLKSRLTLLYKIGTEKYQNLFDDTHKEISRLCGELAQEKHFFHLLEINCGEEKKETIKC